MLLKRPLGYAIPASASGTERSQGCAPFRYRANRNAMFENAIRLLTPWADWTPVADKGVRAQGFRKTLRPRRKRSLDEIAADVVTFHQASEDAPVLAGQARRQGHVSGRLPQR